jgi:hypothetical protein
LFRADKKEFDNATIKQALFMAIHVDQNANWCSKINGQMLKCHEKLNNYRREERENEDEEEA